MPSTIPPGFREAAKLFPNAFVAELASSYKIDASRIPELRSVLAGFAQIYRDTKEEFDDKRRPRELKAEIDAVRVAVGALESRLKTLSPDVYELLWAPEHFLSSLIPPGSENSVTPFGHSIRNIMVTEDSWAQIRLRQSDHFEVLTILRNYCDYALKRLAPDKGGRKRSEALRIWVVNVENYWTKLLGRKFSIASTRIEGLPKSQGARFCIDAFAPVDPRVTPQEMTTAIRDYVGEKRERFQRIERAKGMNKNSAD